MKLKLIGLQIVLTIFTIVILIISVTSVLPAMTGDIDIAIPSEDDLRWDIQEDELYLSGDMWVNNSGYYRMEDINIDVEVLGFNRTLFNDKLNVPSVESGEDKKIELELQTSLDDFTDDELDELVFGGEEENGGIDLKIVSDMTASYPFSIVGFHLDYESIVEWEGLVETFEYHEDNIEFHGNDQGTMVSLPYTVETSDYLSGDSIVDLRLLDEGNDEEYSSTQLDIPLGDRESDTADFIIEDDLVEEFVFNDKDLIISSQITFSDIDLEFDEDESYSWEAPVEELNLFYDEAYVTSDNDQSTLYLPYQVYTTGLSGNADVEITMLNDDETNAYSSDRQYVPLGEDYRDDLEFDLDEVDTEEFITNSQDVYFDIDITLIDKNIQFNTDETYYWGAPLNNLEIEDVRFYQTDERAEGTFSFINDSPRELEMEIKIQIKDVDNITIGSKLVSYQDDPSYIVGPGEEFEDTIELDVSGIPEYAEITFTDDNTGMEFEREVDVDEL
ncbi:MAG: hypothetical protein R6W73_02655 [Candidatus Saliniplasma sp.]